MAKTTPKKPKPLNEKLQKKCEAIILKLAKAETGGIEARYAVAKIVREIEEDGATYGKQAVKLVAKEVGINAKSLYRYATVAKTWNDTAIEKLAEKRNVRGEALTWSHLVALAGLTDEKREAKLKEVLSKNWKANDLERDLKKAKTKKSQVLPYAAALRAYILWTRASVKKVQETMKQLAVAPEKGLSASDLDLLKKAKDEANKLAEEIGRNAELLAKVAGPVSAKVPVVKVAS